MKTEEKKPEEPKLPVTLEDLSEQITNLRFTMAVFFLMIMIAIIINT